jgi:hypothetical protein
MASDAISIELESSSTLESGSGSGSGSAVTSVRGELILLYVSSSTVFYVDRLIDLILWIKEMRKKQRQGRGDDEEGEERSKVGEGRGEMEKGSDLRKGVEGGTSGSEKESEVGSSSDLEDSSKPPSPAIGASNNKAKGIQVSPP